MFKENLIEQRLYKSKNFYKQIKPQSCRIYIQSVVHEVKLKFNIDSANRIKVRVFH